MQPESLYDNEFAYFGLCSDSSQQEAQNVRP
jgi:hypothetical protein